MHNPTAFIRFHATQRPDAVAVVYDGRHISYGELLDRGIAAAGWLRAQGVEAENIVALVMKNSANGRAGGAYVPPFKLAQMMREIEDKSSPEYQRITWEALKKSINGLVNKINSSNVKNIVPELFNENLVRGKGLFARSVMKSQMASPQFSPVFAALVAVTNTKFPELGELVVKRVVLQFRRAFKRNDKSVCVAATKFLASLVNQQVRGVEIVRSLFLFMVSFPSWLVGSFLRFTHARADEFEQHSHRKANDE